MFFLFNDPLLNIFPSQYHFVSLLSSFILILPLSIFNISPYPNLSLKCPSLSMPFPLNVFPSQRLPLSMFSPSNLNSLITFPLIKFSQYFPLLTSSPLNILPSRYLIYSMYHVFFTQDFPFSVLYSFNIFLPHCTPLLILSLLDIFSFNIFSSETSIFLSQYLPILMSFSLNVLPS